MSTVETEGRQRAVAPFQIKDELVTSNIAGTLMLKLCGFVEDQQARILDISEDHLKLKIGYTLFERFWHGLSGHGPLEVTLDIRDGAGEGLADWQRSQARHARVCVCVRPAGGAWGQKRFESCANAVLHRLRLYLMSA